MISPVNRRRNRATVEFPATDPNGNRHTKLFVWAHTKDISASSAQYASVSSNREKKALGQLQVCATIAGHSLTLKRNVIRLASVNISTRYRWPQKRAGRLRHAMM